MPRSRTGWPTASSFLPRNTSSGYDTSAPTNHSAPGISRDPSTAEYEPGTSKKSHTAAQNSSSESTDHFHSAS